MDSQNTFIPLDLGFDTRADEMPDSFKIITAVRIRPLSADEDKSDCGIIASTPAPGEVVVLDPAFFTRASQNDKERKKHERSFCFDFSFCSGGSDGTDLMATQEDIYDSVGKPMLSYVMKGQNCTLFAYGMKVVLVLTKIK